MRLKASLRASCCENERKGTHQQQRQQIAFVYMRSNNFSYWPFSKYNNIPIMLSTWIAWRISCLFSHLHHVRDPSEINDFNHITRYIPWQHNPKPSLGLPPRRVPLHLQTSTFLFLPTAFLFCPHPAGAWGMHYKAAMCWKVQWNLRWNTVGCS